MGFIDWDKKTRIEAFNIYQQRAVSGCYNKNTILPPRELHEVTEVSGRNCEEETDEFLNKIVVEFSLGHEEYTITLHKHTDPLTELQNFLRENSNRSSVSQMKVKQLHKLRDSLIAAYEEHFGEEDNAAVIF